MKKILLGIASLGAALALLPMFAAFEAHVVNVTAKIENALFVHPADRTFGTVFPQEHLEQGIFITFSESFSAGDQNRVGTVEYVIKQKPKPREAYVTQVGVEAARDWCHDPLNAPADPGDLTDLYYVNCMPNLCPYLSKTPDGFPAPSNDVGVKPFHDPNDPANFATGKINKFGVDVGDNWIVDLAVPCFQGHCAQDWASFVTGLNSAVTDPSIYELPLSLEHQVFGCDLWVEVTKIY